MNIYYKFWTDAITRFKNHHPNDSDWKAKLLIMNSFINGLNFWVVLLWLKYFKIYDVELLKIDFFPGTILDKAFAFIIEFVLPFLVLNYLLVFHNNRYQSILEKYNNGYWTTNYSIIYTMFITIGAFVSAIIYGLLTNTP